ncbi:MAG: hypothetical protein BECKG1743D_GA0114223_106551, partial [Candidatus Kentron sp. G]
MTPPFEEIANNMPLVTVIPAGKLFPENGLSPNGEPSLNDDDWLGKNDATVEFEEACELDDPKLEGYKIKRYFYAGRAGLGFGGMALAYDASIDRREGDATPFDTGELYRRNMKPDNLSEDRIRELIRETTEPLAKWRESFKGFLEESFPNPKDYFHKHSRIDADWGPADLPARHRQESDTKFIAWTWEARIHEPHPLLDGLLFWGASRNTYDKLRNYLPRRDSWSSWAEPSWVERLLGTDWGGENRGFFSGLPRRIRIAFLFLQEMSKEGYGTRFTHPQVQKPDAQNSQGAGARSGNLER